MRGFIFFIAALAPLASAQVMPPPLPFTMRVQVSGAVQSYTDGSSVSFAADGVGLPLSGTVTVIYLPTGNSTANLTSGTLTGSTDFTVTGPDLPVTLTPTTASITFNVLFQPSSSRLVTSKIQFGYQEGARSGTFSLILNGSAPEFGFTYQVLPNGNSALLGQGDTIVFPQTALADTSSVLVTITNKGSASGVVNGFKLSGAPEFALAGVPFPPAGVDAGKTLSFNIRFTADQLDPVAGSVRLDFVAGRSLTFNISGSGLGAVYAYDVIQPSSVAALLPNQTVTLPDALVGDKSSVVVRVRNTGNADGRIAAISVNGAAFSLTEVPFTPYTLTAGNAITFTVNFTPTQPGKSLGKLRVGADSFDVSANGLGPQLIYAYTASGTSVQVAGGGSVVFPPAAVGANSSVRFIVTNNGTATIGINSISAGGPTSSTFVLSDVPALPVDVPAGATVSFTATFAPTTVGSISGSLKIDTQTFTLSGVATAPPPLPDYSFQGASGSVDAQQQPAVGLSLSSAYPLALNGTLTLNFNSDVFSNDPAVQFATGGRTVTFTIPAGSKQAVFPNSASQIKLQTGTVAGAITLAPTFATATGAIDLTPQNPPSLMLALPQKAPQLLSVTLSTKTTTGFTLLVTGYATSRSVTQMDFQFTPTPDETVSTTKLSLNVEPSFIAWYGGATSQPFGSLFTATVPFTMQGDVKKVTNVSDTIQSVSVTLTNRQGTSAARSVDLR